MPILSVLAFIATKGNPGAALTHGSYSRNKMEKEHSDNLKKAIWKYTILRDIIGDYGLMCSVYSWLPN